MTSYNRVLAAIVLSALVLILWGNTCHRVAEPFDLLYTLTLGALLGVALGKLLSDDGEVR